MGNVGPADGGGSKKEEPLFPKWPKGRRMHASDVAAYRAQCDTQRLGREVHWAVADKEIGIVFKEGGCVVVRDKHGATVLRITHIGMEGGEPTLGVVPYSAGAPEATSYAVRCDV